LRRAAGLAEPPAAREMAREAALLKGALAERERH
jgi:hypothetical protein